MLALTLLVGCGGIRPESFGWLGSGTSARPGVRSGVLSVSWTDRITRDDPRSGAYSPVEHAQPALDPSRNRVYVGTTEGVLYALDASGRRRASYDLGASIEATPAIDRRRGIVYAVGDDGVIHSLRGRDLSSRWSETAGGPVRQAPLLVEDTLYVVTEMDQVVALATDSGQLLWSYRREPNDGFSISGHAGLTFADGRVLTAFSDGTVVSLDADDGSPVWERDTSVDVSRDDTGAPRFVDVDTTPLVVGDKVYVASFAAGLYELELSSGSVLRRKPEWTGGLGLASAADLVLMTSADEGVVGIDRETLELRWQRAIHAGYPSPPRVARGLVFLGQSRGALLALEARTGREVARLSSGTGFAAAPSVVAGRGFALSNGGSLFAFNAGG
ncbi:MAG: PQQ-binding-like beta-propeller repeat protein [Deltaproteobacteria bacterium]|nr:PQQ-binding-like beta-propeller repeat protein [Deltaproteobacteria bacterium]